MEKIEKIGKLEAIAIIVTPVINHIILNFPKFILISTGTSSWLNIIYISIITFILVLLIIKFFKLFPNKDILDVCEYLLR